MQRRGALGAARSERRARGVRVVLQGTICHSLSRRRRCIATQTEGEGQTRHTRVARCHDDAKEEPSPVGAHRRWNEEQARVRSTLHEYAEHDAQLRGNGAPIWGTQSSSPARSACALTCVAVFVAVISLNMGHVCCSYLLSRRPGLGRVSSYSAAAPGVGSIMYLKGSDERDVSVVVSRVPRSVGWPWPRPAASGFLPKIRFLRRRGPVTR